LTRPCRAVHSDYARPTALGADRPLAPTSAGGHVAGELRGRRIAILGVDGVEQFGSAVPGNLGIS